MRFPPYPAKAHRTGQARIAIAGRSHYLGLFGSERSHREYARLRAEHGAGVQENGDALTIAQMLARWLVHETGWRGADHPEVERIRRACVPLERLYGHTLAPEFTPARLQAVQSAMIDRNWMTDEERKAIPAWSKNYINRQIGRIARVFRWAEKDGYVPRDTWRHLRTIDPIRKNDRRVKQNRPRKAADWSTQIEPTLKLLGPRIAALVLVQFHAGMRPAEACEMRGAEIDRTGPHGCWLFVPGSHKGDWREGDAKLIKVLGPKAQAALTPWLAAAEAAGSEYVFMRKGRPVSEGSYCRAIGRACKAGGIRAWTPYQIRHASKKAVSGEFGLEGARIMLGHSSTAMTAEYSKAMDVERAAEIASKVGMMGGNMALESPLEYNADQIRFLRSVQEVFLKKRQLVEADLYDPPLTVFGRNAVEKFFSPDEIRDLLELAGTLAA